MERREQIDYVGFSFLYILLLSSPELSDTKVYVPQIRALLGTASHFCEVVVLNLRTVPIGTALSLRILRVIRHFSLSHTPPVEKWPDLADFHVVSWSIRYTLRERERAIVCVCVCVREREYVCVFVWVVVGVGVSPSRPRSRSRSRSSPPPRSLPPSTVISTYA